MGTISFLLPENLPAENAAELSRACISGGPDNMPWPSETCVSSSLLTIRRAIDESGYLVAPWRLGSLGCLMVGSSTLMERPEPYEFLVELARGKTNQVRSQLHDWCMGGLQTTPALDQSVRDASMAFGQAVLAESLAERQSQAEASLILAYQAADQLVEAYVEQVFAIRHQRQPRLDTQMGCRLGASTRPDSLAAGLRQACSNVAIDFSWRDLEPADGRMVWDPFDTLLQTTTQLGFQVSGGPLIDFTPGTLPDWVTLYERDAQKLAGFMIRFVEAVLGRYRNKIRRWQLTHGTNWASVLRLGEDDLLWLTVRLIEAARTLDPELELSVGLVQPWGEYMARQERMHSPFIFADTLTRAGMNLAGLGLELVMGISPRGTYCRDLLETSRLIDLYALLGLPLQVTLGYPSSSEPNSQADPALRVGNGNWRGVPSAANQADWAAAFAALALSKPAIHSVQWVHLSDSDPHAFAHCGLIDATGRPKPALQRLQQLREQHLR